MRRLPLHLLTLSGGVLIAALTLYAYRELLARPFAADDYQWLLNVRGLRLRELLRTAFDPGAQTHFYRPLVWLLFWAQLRAFGLDPRGFHMVSLGLHLLNAGLLGWLAWRLVARLRNEDQGSLASSPGVRNPSSSAGSWQLAVGVLAMAIVALHPAPFEAVAWVSAQSELLAAALLLVMLHAWLSAPMATGDQRSMSTSIEARGSRMARHDPQASIFSPRTLLSSHFLLATLALALALLAKESAAIGLPLLVLLGWDALRSEDRGLKIGNRRQGSIFNLRSSIIYLLPTLITLGYVALQVGITRRNYLLAQGGYGLGPQLLLNPLRSLALLAAPLPGSEHADAAWLAPVGAALALLLFLALLRGLAGVRRLVLALGVTLLPTAPFVSPPDSRYLYLPVMAGALLIAYAIAWLFANRTSQIATWTLAHSGVNPVWVLTTDDQRRTGGRWSIVGRLWSTKPATYFRKAALVAALLAVLLPTGRWAAFELHEREWRFAAGAGPGGSLWRAASQFCAADPPERVVLVEPPIAPPHAEAIVALACGPHTRALIVGRDQLDGAIKGRSVVVGFPGGSATVERTT